MLEHAHVGVEPPRGRLDAGTDDAQRSAGQAWEPTDSTLPSWRIRGSQLSPRGRYQLASPRSFIVAGSSIARTIVASIRIATARPTPICLKSSELRVAKIAKTATITTAALVTV